MVTKCTIFMVTLGVATYTYLNTASESVEWEVQ